MSCLPHVHSELAITDVLWEGYFLFPLGVLLKGGLTAS